MNPMKVFRNKRLCCVVLTVLTIGLVFSCTRATAYWSVGDWIAFTIWSGCSGMASPVLVWWFGERHETDLYHVGNLGLSQQALRWTPDGKHIVFSRETGQAEVRYPVNSLYVIASDGSSLLKLSDEYAADHSPIFSPRRITNYILFVQLRRRRKTVL